MKIVKPQLFPSYLLNQGHGVIDVCWFKRNRSLYAREAKLVKENFPKLKFYTVKDRILLLEGEVDLKNGQELVDNYKIEIYFPEDYPQAVPAVKETSGRIPKISDRHISKDGTCCLGPRVLQKEIWDRNPNILNFINDSVIPFLANQSYFERTGEWRNGEFAHGSNGILQSYKERFDIDNKDVILKLLDSLIKGVKIGRNDPCFCRNGKKIKKCHLDSYNKIRSIASKDILERDMKDLTDNAKGYDNL